MTPETGENAKAVLSEIERILPRILPHLSSDEDAATITMKIPSLAPVVFCLADRGFASMKPGQGVRYFSVYDATTPVRAVAAVAELKTTFEGLPWAKEWTRQWPK